MKTNSCPHSGKVFDYLRGNFSERDSREFEVHLAQCKVCRYELRLEKVISGEFSSQLQAGSIERTTLMKYRLRREMNCRFSWGNLVKAFAYACAVAVLGMLFLPGYVTSVLGVVDRFGGVLTDWIESIGSIASLFTNTYILVGIAISLALSCMIYSLYLLKQQLT